MISDPSSISVAANTGRVSGGFRWKSMLFLAVLTFSGSNLWLQMCGDPTTNCHQYAWGGKGWINSPPLQSAKLVDTGPIVVYFSNNDKPIHSGKYLGYGIVKSKWGEKPILYHPLFLSPYGQKVKFYDPGQT